MSGGSMDYLYSKVQDAEFRENTAERKAFRKHLVLVSAALRAIEWNDSGDGASNESVLIRACLAEGAVLAEAVCAAERAVRDLTAEIKASRSAQ